MYKHTIGRIVALLLVLVIAFSLPLAGCKKAETPPADTSGTTEGTTGGSDAGTPGSDGSAGNTLGAWTGAWTGNNFAAGQHYKYTINMIDSSGENTPGWFLIDIADAGNSQYNISYSGNLGMDFSGSFVTGSENIDWGTGINDIIAWSMLMGLMVVPGMTFAFAQPSSWDVGTTWSFGEGEDSISFAITDQRSFGGITGAYGTWTGTDGGVTFCINPNVPLALYLKMDSSDGSYMEYVLTECSGF